MNNFNINKNRFNNQEILQTLYRHMADNGIPCDKEIVVDGKIHRFSRDHKRNKPDEWYIAFEWYSPKNYQYSTVLYGSWSDGTNFIFRSWDSDSRVLDEKERREIQAAFQQRREEAETAIAEEHDQASQSAKEIWEKSEINAPDEKYLAYANLKGIKPIGARFTLNPQGYPSLVVPLTNIGGDIRSLQFISVGEDRTVYKTFHSGGEKKGNFMVLGTLENRKRIRVAEGYSTACSCHEAMGEATVVAFDCGNLFHVVRQLCEKYPNSEIIICADNDAHREDNPGKAAAIKVAIDFGCKIALPQFPNGMVGKNMSDFNDLMKIAGCAEVKRLIEAAELPLTLLLKDVVANPSDKKIRDLIFTIAYQAAAKGDLSQKDVILNQLHKFLKPLGIERTTLTREYRQFVKERGGQICLPGSMEMMRLSDDQKKLIDTLTEEFGVPIPFDHNGKAKGINQMFFVNKFSRECKILYEPIEHAFHEYQEDTGLWVFKTDEKVKIEIGHGVLNLLMS